MHETKPCANRNMRSSYSLGLTIIKGTAFKQYYELVFTIYST